MHIDSEVESKLDPKSRKCTFISYGPDEFIYRFWDGQNWKIIRSKSVIFNEKDINKNRMGTKSSSIEAQVEKLGYVELEEPLKIEDFGNENTLENTVL